MPYIQFLVHYIFLTKNKNGFISENIQQKIYDHIITKCNEKNINLLIVNGYINHLHCLISLNKKQSMNQVANLIKNATANWINENKLINEKFVWQENYLFVEINQLELNKVVSYIKKQKKYHLQQSLFDKIEELELKYNLQKKKIKTI